MTMIKNIIMPLLKGKSGLLKAYAAEYITKTDNAVPQTVTRTETPSERQNPTFPNTAIKLYQVNPFGKKLT